MTRFTVAAFVSLLLLATGGLASAQETDERVERARALFEQAEAHFAGGEYLPAAAAYQNAYDLMREAGRSTAPLILYNVGRAYDRAGQADQARAAYQRFIAEAPADDSEAQARVGTARERLRALQAPTPAPSPAAPIPSAPHPRTSRRQASTDSDGDDTLLVAGITIGVLGAAAILASIGPGLVASSDASELERMCPGGACPSSARGLIDSASTLSLLTDALWIGGLSLAAVGTVLVVIGASSGSDDTPTVACGPLGCSIMGSF